MLGEVVSNCHIRVPVSSRPKYCSVSRFSRTDSWSRGRTSTCWGTEARSLNGGIGTTPLSLDARNFLLRLLLSYVDLGVYTRAEGFQVVQALFCLSAPRTVGIQLLGLFVGFHCAWRELHLFLVSHFLRRHLHQ